MARIRSIKPEFWTSEQVMSVCRDARLLFIGLWNFCDDGGVRPVGFKTLKAQVFPGDDDITTQKVTALVAELFEADLLQDYEIDGKRYWRVTGWHKHQYIEKPRYIYPQPDGKVPSGRILVREAKASPAPPLLAEKVIGGTVKDGIVTLDEPVSTGVITIDEEKGTAVARVPQEEPPKTKKKKPLGDNPVTAEFLAFWGAYPSTNCARGEAWKSYQRAIEKGADHETIICGLAGYNKFLRDTGTLPAHATTWLNQKRWDVDYDAAIAANELARNHRSRPPSPHDKLGQAWAEVIGESAKPDNEN